MWIEYWIRVVEMMLFMMVILVSLGLRCVGGEEEWKGIFVVCWIFFI